MSSNTDVQLAPRERLTRGLKYSAVGPVDVTRGAVGIGAHSVQSAAAGVRRRYRQGQLRRQLAAAQEALSNELAAAGEAVSNMPQALQEARKPARNRKPLLLAVAGVGLLAGGAAAFSIVRRSMQPEPTSPRPPSVEVEPKP